MRPKPLGMPAGTAAALAVGIMTNTPSTPVRLEAVTVDQLTHVTGGAGFDMSKLMPIVNQVVGMFGKGGGSSGGSASSSDSAGSSGGGGGFGSLLGGLMGGGGGLGKLFGGLMGGGGSGGGSSASDSGGSE
jgi:hypothetical protein